MLIKLYLEKEKFFLKEIYIEDNGYLYDILKELEKIGGRYYLFTTDNLTKIDLIDKLIKPKNIKLKEVRENCKSPYIVTQKIFINKI